jgi:hypothetical protein
MASFCSRSIATAGLAAALTLAQGAAAVTLGQIDDFEDGTTQGWVVGIGGMGTHPAPPAVVATGGPGGADDSYLLLTAIGGFGAGGRFAVINASQWSGDYTTSGISGIAMQVNNVGVSDLSLRLLFEDPMGGPPSNAAISSEAIVVPAGSGWISILFPIAPDVMTAVFGSVPAALGNATAVRLFHGADAIFPGEPIVAQLGVDDIRAVPEPGTALLCAFGIAALAARRRH